MYLTYLAFVGTLAFALSGALQASRHRMDIIGFIFIGCITGVGGGTLRDLILDVPVFWLGQWQYVMVCFVGAVSTWLAAPFLKRASTFLVWADAVGMSVFSVLGAQKALELGMSIPVAAIMGMFSACLGGIIRDMILNEVPILLSREIYISASLAGALGYALTETFFGLPGSLALWLGCVTGFGIRALAIVYRLSLPAYNVE